MPERKKEELGRGIRALLERIDTDAERKKTVKKMEKINVINHISLNQIEVNPFQPRADFDEDALNELADSIKVHGVIQPITVRKLGNGNFQLIAGERRTRAARLAGLNEIPAYIREAKDQEMLEIGLIENIQREDLNPLEIARTYERLIEECKLTQEALGNRLGKSRSSITNYLRLLRLPPEVQKGLREKKITMGHARALISVENVEDQLKIYGNMVKKDISVRRVEELVQQLKSGSNKKSTVRNEMSAEWINYRNMLSSKYGAKVNIRKKGKDKGEIVLSFTSEKELDELINKLEGN